MSIAATAIAGRDVGRRPRARRDERWRDRLPVEWARMAVAPVSIEDYRDYEVEAARLVGRDADGTPCFTKHRFVLRQICSDDGDSYYAAMTYGELCTAWRLRDGRWLIHRIVVREGEVEHGRGFYSLSESMPR